MVSNIEAIGVTSPNIMNITTAVPCHLQHKCNLTLKELKRSFTITPMFLLDLCANSN
jgi:hypothetical protein